MTTRRLHRFGRVILAVFVMCGVLFQDIHAAVGTIMPTPFQTVLDTNGNPVSGAKICTYLAGTTTPTATYTDAALLVANSNPIVADSAGRFTAYLSPGASYKFIYQDATGTAGTCNGVVIKTVDNVSAVPSAAVNLDVTGTAGEALTAAQVVYLSDGSGSKNAGQWYKADAALAYSSTLPQIGMVPSSISSGASGTIRLVGQMTGLTVVSGLTYYVGTGGAITSTAPVQARRLGVADSATTLVLKDLAPPTQAWVDDFRLTLTSGTPITTADVTGASAVTLYCSPLTGNRIDLPDSLGNPQRVTSAEFSIAVPATTSQMYDVFAYLNGATATLELLAWTNDTTRATAIIRTTTGRLYKTGDLTRMYIGSFRTTAVSGQTEDSFAKRYVYNYYNRATRPVQRYETTASWTYSSATIRQANGATANQVDIVTGVLETPVSLTLNAAISQTAAGALVTFGLAQDSTTTFGKPYSIDTRGGAQLLGNVFQGSIQWTTFPSSVGRHFFSWNEQNASAVVTTTWQGSGFSATIGIDGVTVQ